MNFRIFFFITLFIACCQNASAGLHDHLDMVKKNCQGANALLIKKSLLEMKRFMNCDEKFTTQLLQECGKLKCSALLQSFQKNIQARSGAVVGE